MAIGVTRGSRVLTGPGWEWRGRSLGCSPRWCSPEGEPTRTAFSRLHMDPNLHAVRCIPWLIVGEEHGWRCPMCSDIRRADHVPQDRLALRIVITNAGSERTWTMWRTSRCTGTLAGSVSSGLIHRDRGFYSESPKRGQALRRVVASDQAMMERCLAMLLRHHRRHVRIAVLAVPADDPGSTILAGGLGCISAFACTIGKSRVASDVHVDRDNVRGLRGRLARHGMITVGPVI